MLPARKFVWWYNGHPHGGDVGVDLAAVRSVAVLGVGNVALDCARLLLAPEQRLAPTDVADRAVSQLRRSAVQNVHLVARRSPAEVRLLETASAPRQHFTGGACTLNACCLSDGSPSFC